MHRWTSALALCVCGSLIGACTAKRALPGAGAADATSWSEDCSAIKTPDPAVLAMKTPVTGDVITTLQTRDHEVTVYAGGDGLRFTIATAGGTVLGQAMTQAQFELSFPGLFERYDTAFAGEDVWLDASVSPPAP